MPASEEIRGFTLIELSIVLVIIGLIVGGVLAGRDLIGAATERAQVTQIEKFNSAANTFFGKYGYLPGDIPAATVAQLGFTVNPTRTGSPGCGDGDGELDGTNYGVCNTTSSAGVYSYAQGGELTWFWQDLSSNTHLIEGGFSKAIVGTISCVSLSDCSSYFPAAKIGNGAFVYVYSGSANNCTYAPATHCGPNYFGLSVINSVSAGNVIQGAIPPAPALTEKQAYDIDAKIDDGMPITGNVRAQYLTVASSGKPGWSTNAATPGASTCYDTSSGTAAYSVTYQNGSNVNCGISFKLQAGD